MWTTFLRNFALKGRGMEEALGLRGGFLFLKIGAVKVHFYADGSFQEKKENRKPPGKRGDNGWQRGLRSLPQMEYLVNSNVLIQIWRGDLVDLVVGGFGRS